MLSHLSVFAVCPAARAQPRGCTQTSVLLLSLLAGSSQSCCLSGSLLFLLPCSLRGPSLGLFLFLEFHM